MKLKGAKSFGGKLLRRRLLRRQSKRWEYNISYESQGNRFWECEMDV